ncbi:MAG TPA: hypothetical protein VFT68_18485 [Lapillicoccus sp.]|nr:hypothetical protein [Lapillicoccus sp.]
MAPKYARKALDEALAASKLDDQMVAVGLFSPRGSSGGMIAGGLVGDVVGGLGGVVGSALGDLAGASAGRKVAGDIHNLPKDLIVGVSKEWVYGASMPGRKTPSILLFRVTRDGLVATTKDRLSVRILELQVLGDAEPIRLEGNRNPMTGAKSVISELTG